MKKILIIPAWLNDILVDNSVNYEDLANDDLLPSILSEEDVDLYLEVNENYYYRENIHSTSLMILRAAKRLEQNVFAKCIESGVSLPAIQPKMPLSRTGLIYNMDNNAPVHSSKLMLEPVFISGDTMGIIVTLGEVTPSPDVHMNAVKHMLELVRRNITDDSLFKSDLFIQWAYLISLTDHN